MAEGAFSRLRGLLEPLRLYDFDSGGISRAELEAAGEAIDDFMASLDRLQTEIDLLTAGEEGVSRWEDLLDLHPPGDLAARRRAVLALLSAESRGPGMPALRSTLAACGLKVNVREASGERELIEVSFPDVAGVPADFERVQAIIQRLTPCHLEVAYVYNYITWILFEAHFPTWDDLDDSELSWGAIELIIN